MASDDKAAMAMATDDGADMHMATNDEVATPTASEMGEDHMSIEEESHSPSLSVSHGQIDGNTHAVWRRYVDKPPTPNYAKVQGTAKLREVLNDPDGKIAGNIKNIQGFNKRLSSNNHCKKVRKYLTGDKETPITDGTVPFILAIWCVLGEFIPSMSRERIPGRKKGSRLPLTDWGKKMIEELGNLGIIGGYKFDICQAHAAKKEGKSQFNWTRAKHEILEDDTEQATKKPKRNAKPPSLGKRGASSPRQSPASKRRKNVAIEKPQQGGGSYSSDDDTEDEGNRGEVRNEVMYGGSKPGLPASRAPPTNIDSNRGGLQHPEVPRNGYRDQDDIPPPLQGTWPLPGADPNQCPEGNLGNDAVTRRYGPGLKTSDMSPDETFMGRMSHGRNEGFTVEKPSASGVTTGMLPPSYWNVTSSSGQHRFGMPSALQQGSTASSSRTRFEVSAPVNRGSAVPHAQLHSALEHLSGSGDANTMNDSQFGHMEDDLFSPSQQGSMPGRHRNTLQVTNPVNRGSDTQYEEFATENCEDSDRLDEAVCNSNKSDASFSGAQPGYLGQDNSNRTSLSFHLPTIIAQLEGLNKQNDKEVSLLSRNDKAKDAKIAALEEEVNIWRAAGNEIEQLKSRNTELEEISKKSRQTADLLNRTSAFIILQRAGITGKGLGTIFFGGVA
ncbi:hypothetical protein LA080_003653 [Diaporthe eres]|nr:hypothetical protein LA080_003653 [Diaporthe eres]